MLLCSADVQGVRSLTRFYLVLFLPIFFGPYWSWVAQTTDFGFAFFFSILVRGGRARGTGLMVLLLAVLVVRLP